MLAQTQPAEPALEPPLLDAITEPALTVYEQHPVVAVLVLVLVGLAFLLWGYRLYRWLVVLACVGLGAVLGLMAATYLEVGQTIPIAIGSVVLGVLAWPLHRLAWGLLGGVVFSMAAAGVAAYLAVEDQVHLILISVGGFVVGSALTVLLLKPLIIVITSLVGALFVAVGTLRLITLWPEVGDPILRTIDAHAILAAGAVLVLAAVGSAMQMFGAADKERKKRRASDEE